MESKPAEVVAIAGHDARFREDHEAEAFVPHDLPTHIDLPGSVRMTVSQAAGDLGRLDAAAPLIPNPQLVARVATRREAIGTSALEGTFAGLPELFAAETQPEHEPDDHIPPNVREVMNDTRAADSAFDWIKDRPITVGLLSALQAQIVRGIHRRTRRRIDPHHPGLHRRQTPNGRRRPIRSTTPGRHLAGNVRELGPLAHRPRTKETHPAHRSPGDGPPPFRNPAPLHRRQRSRWPTGVRAPDPPRGRAPLARPRTATAVSAEASTGHDRIMRLLELREEFAGFVRTAKPRARIAVEIAEQLIAYPILTLADDHRRHDRSNQDNRNAITTIVDLGLLEPYSDDRYDQMNWSPRVFQVIDA